MGAGEPAGRKPRGLLAKAGLLVVALAGWCLSATFSAIVAVLLVGAMSPASVGRHVLTDGSRVVVFREMVHVGTKEFYDRVRDDIAAQKAAGAAYFFEGITLDGDRSVNEVLSSRLLGTSADSADIHELFEVIAELGGMQTQPQQSFVGLPGGQDRNVDVGARKLLEMLDASGAPQPNESSSGFSGEDIAKTRQALAAASNVERAITAWTVRSLMRFGILILPIMGTPAGIDGPVIDERNRVLADAVVQGPERIVVTYGQLHFNGFLRLLKERDPRWRIVETQRDEAF